ncbi:MAG: hypothetical protein JJU06_07465 [Ectothiorhodospiraceae bacterium]|nr:hypothetical protein [Ectothiorhodospiraceae bacterium]
MSAEVSPTLEIASEPVEQTLSVSGRHSREILVSEPGRHAFIADGDMPVGVQLVDRMAGPLETRRHRHDRIFGAGLVKAVLHPDGEGEVAFRVHPYRELHQAPFPRLTEARLLETTLEDFQQRSYWVVVDEPRWMTLELAGRYLDDVRLWRDGEWLTDVVPDRRRIEPESGRPLQARTVHTRLQPGIYRLTVYGGQGERWAEEAEGAPLYLRKGIPELPAYGWWQHRTSPFGVDRWRVNTTANVYQLKLDEAEPARLSVGPLAEGADPFGVRLSSAVLDRDARLPEVTVRDGDGHRPRLITVEHAPGQPYRLAYLHHGTRYSLHRPHTEAQWIGIAGLGDPRDSVQATVAVVDHELLRRGVGGLLTGQLPTVSERQAWRDRFNLLRPVDLLLQVEDGGTYRAELTEQSEAIADFRIQPLYQSAPHTAGTDWQAGSRHVWELNAGLYRLSLRPAAGHPGIAELRIGPDGDDHVDEAEAVAVRDAGMLRLVDSGRSRIAEVNDFDHGGGGLVIRTTPLRLEQVLPVTQAGGSIRDFPVQGVRGRTLVAEAPDGSLLPIAARRQGPWDSAIPVNRDGPFTAYVRNDADRPVNFHLRWQQEPPAVVTHADLDVLPQQVLASRIQPPAELPQDGEVRLTLPHQSRQSLLLRVTEPALYRLESTGLLDTRGELRDRTTLELASSTEGGSGRNFLIQRYLRDGEYRLVTGVQGRSAGPMAVRLARTPIDDGGLLPPDTTGRATLSPEGAIRYTVPVSRPGPHRIHVRGLEQDFAIQLDGPDGWPVIVPGSRTPLTVRLEPGEHTLTVIPQAVTARAVTRVRAPPEPAVETEGHGPHPLPLNARRSHLWREPGDGQSERHPDQWEFALDAPMDVRVDLHPAMEAELQRRDDRAWRPVARIRGAVEPAWHALEAGDHRLLVRAARRDDRRSYRLAVSTRELPFGQSRRVAVPGSVPLSLAEDGMVQLWSLSGLDVEATLRDADGHRVAFSDSRPDDWNFLISRHLPAGRYSLELNAADGRDGEADIALAWLERGDKPALAAGDDAEQQERKVHAYPLALPDVVPEQGYPLLVETRSRGTHGLSLERLEGDRWQVLHTVTGRTNRAGLVLAGTDAAPHRLQVWPLDDGQAPVQIAVGTAPDSLLEEPGAGDTLMVQPRAVPGTGMTLASSRLPVATLQQAQGADDLLWAHPGGVFRPAARGWIPATEPVLWLVGDREPAPVTLTAPRLRAGQRLDVPVASAVRLPVDDRAGNETTFRLWLAESAGPAPVVRAAERDDSRWTVAGRSAVAVALPGEEVALLEVRRADGVDRPATLRLEQRTLAVEDHGALAVNARRQVHLEAGTVAQFVLPDGAAHELRLAGPAGIAAITGGGNDGQVHWTGLSAGTVRGPVRGGVLWLANAGESSAGISLSLLPAGAHRHLEPGRMLHLAEGHRGERIVSVSGLEPDAVIRLGGDLGLAYMLTGDGRMIRSANGMIAVGNASRGRLHLAHGTGAYGVWIEADDGPEWTEAATISTATPALLGLRSPAAAVARVGERGDYWLDAAHPVDVLLPAGEHRLRFALAGTGGVPEWRLASADPMPEGLGEPVRLAPGESRVFGFRLDEERTVGVGLRADQDVVQGRLMDAHGEVLGEGVVQLHRDLPAGNYYLIAHLPPDQAPVLVRAALVGSEAPEDLVPDEVRRRLSGQGQE